MEHRDARSDSELGKEMQQGSEEAYREVVRRFIRPIYSICLKTLRDPVEAEDVTQDVFMRMYKGIHTYDPDRPLNSWLFRIAYNRCMDYLKKRGRNIEIPMEEVETSTTDQKDPITSEKTDKVLAQMWEAVDELPDQHKMVLLFKYRFEMKNADIANALDITENNLRVKLYRAKQVLRAAMERKLRED